MPRVVPCLFGLAVLMVAGTGGAQPAPPAAARPPRPTAVERPWTTTPGSPYDRAQAVAAERLRQATPTIDFPVVDAPPDGDLPGDAPGMPAAVPAPKGGHPTALQRPWSADAGSPHGRAQAVAVEHLRPDTRLYGASPYPDEYRSPVPAPFRPAVSTPWSRGGMLYPALPFPAIGATFGRGRPFPQPAGRF